MIRRVILLLIFPALPFLAASQDLSGFWKGSLVMAPGGCFPVYNIELQLQMNGDRITGTAYHFSDSLNFVRENLEGTYHRDSNRIVIQETGIITYRLKEECVPCVKRYVLSFHWGGGNVVTEEQLRGSWTGKSIDKKTACDPGTLILIRTERSSFKPEKILPSSLTGRKAELVREIRVDTGEIRLDFYDNGQVDGDTISVYVNQETVVSNKRLSTKPVTVTVRVDLNKTVQEVIMVGENMGEIPPNTALMVVTSGDKRYQLYLTSDERKNALVRFIYEKPGNQ